MNDGSNDVHLPESPKRQLPFPLRPVLPGTGFGAGKAIAAFGASAFVGFAGFVGLTVHQASMMCCRGATRSARLVKLEARRALDEAAAEEKAREP